MTKMVPSSSGVRGSTARALRLALTLAAISPALARADLPPYGGAADDASYGDMPHATITSPGTAPERDVVAGVAAYDDVTYAAEAARPAAERVATGRLVAIDGSAIVVHPAREADVRLVVDPSTPVAMDGREASLAELTAGAEIRAAYEEVRGAATATRVEARSGAQDVQAK